MHTWSSPFSMHVYRCVGVRCTSPKYAQASRVHAWTFDLATHPLWQNGLTALMAASHKGRSDAVKRLLENKANIEATFEVCSCPAALSLVSRWSMHDGAAVQTMTVRRTCKTVRQIHAATHSGNASHRTAEHAHEMLGQQHH